MGAGLDGAWITSCEGARVAAGKPASVPLEAAGARWIASLFLATACVSDDLGHRSSIDIDNEAASDLPIQKLGCIGNGVGEADLGCHQR